MRLRMGRWLLEHPGGWVLFGAPALLAFSALGIGLVYWVWAGNLPTAMTISVAILMPNLGLASGGAVALRLMHQASKTLDYVV